MAAHSSIPAQKVPQTGEPGGLQSKGLQKVRQDLATEHSTLWGSRVGTDSVCYPLCQPNVLVFQYSLALTITGGKSRLEICSEEVSAIHQREREITTN